MNDVTVDLHHHHEGWWPKDLQIVLESIWLSVFPKNCEKTDIPVGFRARQAVSHTAAVLSVLTRLNWELLSLKHKSETAGRREISLTAAKSRGPRLIEHKDWRNLNL